MSLDISLEYKVETHGDIPEDESYVDIEDMGLYYERLNITHNLTTMADKAMLYEVLWNPHRLLNIDERDDIKAKHLLPILARGLNNLKTNKEDLLQYNPDNGWGSYDGLLRFVQNYIKYIKAYPNAYIRIYK